MTRRLGAAAIAAACLASATTAAQQAPQQPIFRSTADAVTVDVSVRAGGVPVGGLTAKDFVLLDNGVPQTIESVEMEVVPLDVSVLIDANDDVLAWADSMIGQVPGIGARLRAGDRLRVMSIGSHVADVVRARAAAAIKVEAFPAGGISSVYDGLAAALVRPVDRSRRHVIVAITNGIDAVSSLDAPDLVEIARRSDALLHIVQVDVALVGVPGNMNWQSGRSRYRGAQRMASGLSAPTRPIWRAYDEEKFGRLEQVFTTLRAAAESTGGALHPPGLFTSASRIFGRVIDEYRRSYLLRYAPAGVPREGWHDITVTVPAYPSYRVNARRGYSVEAPGGTERASNVPAPPLTAFPQPRDALVELYNRGAYDGIPTVMQQAINLASVIDDFRKAGNPWPSNPRREALMAIELAEAALHARGTAPRAAARELLLAHRKLIRHPIAPDQFERVWLWAALAAVAGVNQQELARDFSEYAATRFPDEPRFVLARAFVLDQSRAFDATDSRTGAAQESHVRELTARYDAAMQHTETAAEARVRKAFFLHRIGRHADALAALDAAGAAGAERDAMMGYLRHLFRGRVLEALERFDDARAAYASARTLQPGAQSPKVALMRLLVRAGDWPAAEALAAAIQTAPADSFDPWWMYWLGDYRMYPEVIARLREQTR